MSIKIDESKWKSNIDYPLEHILWRNNPRLDSSVINC